MSPVHVGGVVKHQADEDVLSKHHTCLLEVCSGDCVESKSPPAPS